MKKIKTGFKANVYSPVVLTILLGIALIFLNGAKLPVLDRQAETYFEDAIIKAGTSYAACRMINAGVSVLKESEVGIEPMGVGVNVAVGQVLDPIDDMTERLSDVLVTAVVSLGVQKILHTLTISLVPTLLGICLITWFICNCLKSKRAKKLQKLALRLSVLLIVARLCLPVSAIVSHVVYQSTFEQQINQSVGELPLQQGELENFTTVEFPESDGFFDKFSSGMDVVADKASEFKAILSSLYEKSGDIIVNLVRLTFLYVGLFIVQVILLPLTMFYLLTKLFNSVITP